MPRSTYTPTADDSRLTRPRCQVCHVRTKYPATHAAYHAVLVPTLLPTDPRVYPNQETYRSWAATVEADQKSRYTRTG